MSDMVLPSYRVGHPRSAFSTLPRMSTTAPTCAPQAHVVTKRYAAWSMWIASVPRARPSLSAPTPAVGLALKPR